MSKTINTINKKDFDHNIERGLNEFAEKLLKSGFTLYTKVFTCNKTPNTFFSFSKDGKFGDVQNTNYSGVSFSSCYVGGRKNGTGARYSEEYAELTVENALGCLNYTLHSQRRDSITFHTEQSFCTGTFANSKLILECSK